MIDISIVVPIYNVEKWLAECLESLVNQTLREIEIICVDDGSTDGSVAVVRQYMERDSRIKLIQQKNSGTVIARKRAVEIATGRYFLFVDPDDYLALDACEKLVHEMEARGCDILQFGVEIHEMSARTEAQRKKSAGYFNPQPRTYEGVEILRASYLRMEIPFSVIFRCFDGGLVRRAFKHIPDVYSINETDVFVFFFLAYHARKFVSIADRYYHYRYGIGISTKKEYTLPEFQRVLCKFDTLRVIKNFVERESDGNEDLKNAYLAVENRMVANAFGAVFGRMKSRSDTIKAFELARERVGILNCIKWLSVKYAGKQADCAEMLLRYGLMEHIKARKDIRHIGLSYYRLSFGGTQRVVQQEINAFRQQGLKVTLFLEEKLTEECYPIPSDVEVVYLPKTIGADHEPEVVRCERLAEALATRDIDIFYSHTSVSTTMLWDMLVCKWQYRIPFVLHFHTLFTSTLYSGIIPTQFPALIKVLKCVDMVIAISRADAAFFRTAGIPVAYLQNPVDAPLVDICKDDDFSRKDPHLVLWVGRMSWEKRPLDAVKIFNELHKVNPAARLVMVGGGQPDIVAKVKAAIAEKELQDVITLEGQQLNTYPYYLKASVFLSTSLIEGFQLTALEALCAGVPIVAYAIPHLDLYRDNHAVIQVPQGDVKAAAEALGELLQRADICALRLKAKEFVSGFCAYDFAAELEKVIVGLAAREEAANCLAAPSAVSPKDFALCIDMIVSGIASACGRGVARINELNRQLAEAQKRRGELWNERETLKSALSAAKSELAESKKRRSEIWAERETMKASLKNTKQEIDRKTLELQKKEASAKNNVKKLASLQREVTALKSSEAYRTGMMVTWPARKAWGGVKCLRDNGVKYTLKHALGKILRKFGSKVKW